MLTNTFYLLKDFPGRFSNGRLWVEALPDQSEEEEENRETGVHGERLGVTDSEVAAREELQLQHRLGRSSLIGQKRDEGHSAADQRNEDDRTRPAVVRLLDQGEDEAAEPERTESSAEEVHPASTSTRGSRHRNEDQSQRRDVER